MIDADYQRLLRALVDDVQHPESPVVESAVLNEVTGPDMVRPFQAQQDAGPVIEPEAALRRLLVGNLEILAPSDALHPLAGQSPARGV